MPVRLLHLLAVIFSVQPVVFLVAALQLLLKPASRSGFDACTSSSPTCGDLFCAACSLSCSDTSANGSILNSNVSSSSTILHCRELDSSNSLLPNALLFRSPFSATHCSGETHTSPGKYHVCLDFKTFSILCMYKQSTFSSS